jgi:hypothetical protein
MVLPVEIRLRKMYVCMSVCLFQYCLYVVSVYLYVVLLSPEFVELYRDG